MQIAFDVRPRDRRRFAALRRKGLPLQPCHLSRLGSATWAASLVLWYRYPHALGPYETVNLLGMPVLCIIMVLTLRVVVARLAAGRRVWAAAGLTEGQHNIHLSEFGVHHVAPGGTYRYPWARFEAAEVAAFQTSSYVLLRFREDGTLGIPVSALEGFGVDPVGSFMNALVRLVRAGRNR